MNDRFSAAPGTVTRAEIRTEPWSVAQAIEELTAAVTDPAAGAVVTFVGTVRNADQGRSVTRLDYAAHPRAEVALAAALASILAPGPPGSALRVAAVHRAGRLSIGDPALVVAVSAEHRAEAFDACAALVDRIKATVPVWKHQVFADGSSQWVGLP
ncbi:MAG TPA: molybdenum cofactor biosynthesis protein MoaE [Dermatophilaceae bacterium]|nr:molybdenum cofactor biosynthesis protein MoaE [Dermatophilaceae bacterium]